MEVELTGNRTSQVNGKLSFDFVSGFDTAGWGFVEIHSSMQELALVEGAHLLLQLECKEKVQLFWIRYWASFLLPTA